MTLIEQFLQRYLREFDFYREVAHLCAQECENLLDQSGIRSIVTYRAKRPDKLENKVAERAKTKSYQSIEDIFSDIVDLAGVRIALYFPGEEREVHKLIQDRFIVDERKTFSGTSNDSPSYKNRFPGYCAQHYLIRLRKESLGEANHRYALARVEIQVASVLMHAWAEVEHDLIYKPLTGVLSVDEYAILDEINGLVITGEIALERLQRAMQSRIVGHQKEFANHYELASYLYDVMRPHLTKEEEEPFMGRTDTLLSFLRAAGMAKPEKLIKFTANLDPYAEGRPIAEQIIDRVLEAHPNLYAAYSEIRQEVESRYPYKSVSSFQERQLDQEYHQAIGYFLSRWVAFERAVTRMGELIYPDEPIKWRLLGRTLPFLGLDETKLEQIKSIRNIRNYLVHGHELPHSERLLWAARSLEEILSDMRDRAQGPSKKILEEVSKGLDTRATDQIVQSLWTLRERGVQLRNQLITPEELPQWTSEFEKWHSELLEKAEMASPDLRKWLAPLDKVRAWDLTFWVNEEHRLKLNMISELLDRLAKYLTRDLT
jgi:ppGpp synthetase/RelA/SpoT-type nucleotidyltranferase